MRLKARQLARDAALCFAELEYPIPCRGRSSSLKRARMRTPWQLPMTRLNSLIETTTANPTSPNRHPIQKV